MLQGIILDDERQALKIETVVSYAHLLTYNEGEIRECVNKQIVDIIADDVMSRTALPILDSITPEIIKEQVLYKIGELLAKTVIDKIADPAPAPRIGV